ncbi:MAG: J domain-containing protein [Pyrinomonadaceae bacterium]
MVNYYDILKVSQNATGTEIKSAYRRLARKLHPDKNSGAEDTALKFAAIAEAYEVLGNAAERSKYDRRLLETDFSETINGDSVLASSNPHAKRWRQMAYEKRYNDIIDRMIAEERNEAIALQRFIFPLVALGVSALFVGMVRPNIFLSDYFTGPFGVVLKIGAVSFFIVGIIHVIGRIRESLDRYAFDDNDIHESVLDQKELPARRWSRYSISAVIILGVAGCLGLGTAIFYISGFRSVINPLLFSTYPSPDIVLFPPIFVLIVDLIHGLLLNYDT